MSRSFFLHYIYIASMTNVQFGTMDVTNKFDPCFIKVLIVESKKVHPNMIAVNELMDCTFSFRRKDILTTSGDIETITAKYPFLQHSEQVIV